jgi:probable HAF family extracellular repeat protein
MLRFTLRLAPVVALATLALATSRPAAAENYVITDLGTLPGYLYNWTWQQTINNRGEIAAYANNGDQPGNILDPNAFAGDASYLWKNGAITPLPGLPGATDTITFSLNDYGRVVGRSTVPGRPNYPVLWVNGVIQALPELPGDNKGGALMINNRSWAVGYSQNTATGIRRAVLWDTWYTNRVTLIQLPALPGGGGWDEALGINQEGQMVGFSGPASGLEHATLWDKGKAMDLGTLGGAWGDGYAINNWGQVVGQAATATASGGPDAFLWDKGVMHDLGTYGSDVTSLALAINYKGQIVGSSSANLTDAVSSHALLWENGKMINLQTKVSATSGWTLLGASGINNNGQIVGIGLHNGQYRNFLLTPTSLLGHGG